MPPSDQSESVWLVYDERGWTPEPAVVVRGVAPAKRYGYRIEGPFVLEPSAWLEINGRRLSPPDEPEWHTGGTAMRGYPDAIRVQTCRDCGLRTGQEWQDCPASGFRHRLGEVRIYKPAFDEDGDR
jgi:hypothetical protein